MRIQSIVLERLALGLGRQNLIFAFIRGVVGDFFEELIFKSGSQFVDTDVVVARILYFLVDLLLVRAYLQVDSLARQLRARQRLLLFVALGALLASAA